MAVGTNVNVKMDTDADAVTIRKPIYFEILTSGSNLLSVTVYELR